MGWLTRAASSSARREIALPRGFPITSAGVGSEASLALVSSSSAFLQILAHYRIRHVPSPGHGTPKANWATAKFSLGHYGLKQAGSPD
jgi:hypothetical protein